jgi:hypothetical protein
MTLLSNASLSMSNSSIVFSSQNAYTSMELYYAIVALFSIFVVASLFLDGGTKPFEKLFAAIVGFVFSVSIAISSFSLAIINVGEAGSLQQIAATAISQQKAIAPMIIMQNSQTWQIISWIVVILCFVNIINCILVLIDYSRIKGVTKGAL